MKKTLPKSFFKIHRERILNIALISLSVVILLDIFIIFLNITELTTAELELIVTLITGITTIVIIAWALNESRKSNRLLMYQNQSVGYKTIAHVQYFNKNGHAVKTCSFFYGICFIPEIKVDKRDLKGRC